MSHKQNPNISPAFSIIIAVYKAAKYLPRLLESICHQEVASRIEVIIIDAESEDGTEVIVEEYSDRLQIVYICESDSGIYDAWNKGLRIASGEWILFCGADDELAEKTTLKLLHDYVESHQNANLVASRACLVNWATERRVRIFGRPWGKAMLNSMVLSHPGLLHRRDLFEGSCFDPAWKIAGDYEFLLRNREKIAPGFVNVITVNVGDEGISRQNIIQVLKEGRLIQLKTGAASPLRASINYYFAAAKSVIRKLIRNTRGVRWWFQSQGSTD